MAGLRLGGFPTRLPRLTLTGALTVTTQSTTALTVARTGTTYAFQVDTNTANSATGLKVTAAAAAGGVALAAISSGADEPISLASKGAAALTLLTNSLTRVTVASTGAVTIAAPTSGVGLTVSGGGTKIVGQLAVGTDVSTNITGFFAGTLTAANTDQYGLNVDVVPSSSATVSSHAAWLRARSPAAAVTCAEVAGLYVANAVKGAGSTITSQYGILVKTQTQGGTNNYGIYVETPSGGSGSNIGLYNAGTTTLAAATTISTTATAGGATTLTITPGAHTALTAEKQDITLAAHSVTLTDGTTIALARSVVFGATTYVGAAAGGTETVTTAINAEFGLPVQGANLTMTNAPIAARFLGNVVVGNILTPAAGPTNTLSIASGTAPTEVVADSIMLYSSDDAVGHTIPSFWCEGTNVLATGQADSVSATRVKMRINGTVVTLLAI